MVAMGIGVLQKENTRGYVRAHVPSRKSLPNADAMTSDTIALLTLAIRAVVARVLREPSSHPDVEDAVQEALRRVFEKPKSENAAPPVGSEAHRRWAVGVARHVALDVIRGRQRQRARFEPISDDSSRELSAPDTAHDEAAIAREDVARLRGAIDALPEGQRRAVILFHIEGLAYEAIASRLGVPIGTVATWLLRAKTTLHGVLARADLSENRS